VVCLDEKGDLLHNDLIYIHEGNKTYEAGYKLKDLVAKYSIEVLQLAMELLVEKLNNW
jgi:uncharacterized protein